MTENETAVVPLSGSAKPLPPDRTAWRLPLSAMNEPMLWSLRRLIKRCLAAHFTDVHVRINGKWEIHEADWIKHLVEGDGAKEAIDAACANRDKSSVSTIALQASTGHPDYKTVLTGEKQCQMCRTVWHEDEAIASGAHVCVGADRLAALERDAARYRWLRSEPTDQDEAPTSGLGVSQWTTEPAYDENVLHGDELDAAIDAALQSAEGKGGSEESLPPHPQKG